MSEYLSVKHLPQKYIDAAFCSRRKLGQAFNSEIVEIQPGQQIAGLSVGPIDADIIVMFASVGLLSHHAPNYKRWMCRGQSYVPSDDGSVVKFARRHIGTSGNAMFDPTHWKLPPGKGEKHPIFTFTALLEKVLARHSVLVEPSQYLFSPTTQPLATLYRRIGRSFIRGDYGVKWRLTREPQCNTENYCYERSN